MALKIIVKPLAEIDVDDAVAWYNEQNENLGEKFLYSFRDAVKVVSLHPTGFRKRYKTIRSFALKNFPYNVYYIIDGQIMFIIAVIHQKRNPKIWRKRN